MQDQQIKLGKFGMVDIEYPKSFYLKQRIIVWFHWAKVNMRFPNSYLIQ